MVYQWKISELFDVDAQTAGEELDRIYGKYGMLKPAQIVEESRDEKAPLHTCFEWNDDVAAEKYREVQAQGIVRAIVTVVQNPEDGEEEPVTVRVYHNTELGGYEPVTVILNDDAKMEKIKADALRELSSFRRKYNIISELQPVFDVIDSLTA